jgi:DNA mismatch endonuclease (patch repair protein)
VAGWRWEEAQKTLKTAPKKIEKNMARDRANIALLRQNGWKVLTVWQCELKTIDTLAKKLYEFFEND